MRNKKPKKRNYKIHSQKMELSEIINQKQPLTDIERQLASSQNKEEEIFNFADKNSSQYDLVIKMDSIYDLEKVDKVTKEPKKGFHIELKNNFNPIINQSTNVAILGQVNSGKTFLTNQMMNENFNSDSHSHTQGICLKMSNVGGRNIAYLDCEPFNKAVTFGYTTKQECIDYKNLKRQNKSDETHNLRQIERDTNNKYQDVSIVEQLQSGFVLSISNIAIYVVSSLTQEDQKRILSIQNTFYHNSQSTINKRMIILHNLKDKHEPEYISQYVNQLKDMFLVDQIVQPEYEQSHENECNYYLSDYRNTNISHILMVNKDSKTSHLYNNFALFYIKQIIALYTHQQQFNVPKQLHTYMDSHIKNYILAKRENSDTPFEEEKEDHQEYLLQLEMNSNKITFKDGIFIDKIRDQQHNVFGLPANDHPYRIINSNDGKTKYVQVEVSGFTKLQSRFEKNKGILNIKITQLPNENTQGTVQKSTISNEDVIFAIKICDKNLLWNRTENFTQLQNGLYQSVFKFDESNNAS